MRIILLYILLLTFNWNCIAQRKKVSITCEGLSILDVKPYIRGYEPCSHCDISIDSLKNGFSISISDPNYQITGLRVVYTNNKNEVTVRDIAGSQINKKNFAYLDNIEVGNFFSIECINIRSNDQLANSTTMLIYVTN